MQDQQPSIWACLIITFILATFAISLRILSRKLTGVYFWWDDWLACVGYLISVSWIILTPIWIHYGLGKHIEDITERPVEDTLYINKLCLFIAELFYAFSLFFAKSSILMFYWRMFGVTNIKRVIQILLGCAIIWIIIRTFMGIWHCIPIQAFWDSNAGGHCAINDSKFFLGTLTVHICIDIAILTVPIVQIRKLRLPKLQKMAVMVMFMFGIFICIAAIVIIVESINFDAGSLDFTWNIAIIVIWATVEVNLVVVSTCLPILRPSFNFILGRRLTTRSGDQTLSEGYSRGPVSTKKSVKRSNMTRHHENSSTYQLADSVREGSSAGEFEEHAMDSNRVVNTAGHSAFVSAGKKSPDEEEAPCDMEGRQGVLVKSETTIRISKASDKTRKDSDGF